MQVTRRDIALMRRTLRHLTAAGKLVSTILVVLAALLWWQALERLLAFGDTLDYSGLQSLGEQTIALLQKYNPVFWWLIAILATLLVAYLMYGLVMGLLRRSRGKLVSRAVVERLAQQLSAPACQVLSWSWENRRNPISVGVLQQALLEMLSGRAGKISLAQEHASLLREATGQPQPEAEREKDLAFSLKV